MSKPHIGGVEHEIGDVVSVTFYPLGADGPIYGPVEVRVASWDEATKTMGFEGIDGMPFSIGGPWQA